MQYMVYPHDHPDPKLRGEPKGMKAVLQERGIVWELLMSKMLGGSPVGTCASCRKSQAAKDAEARLAAAKAAGREDQELPEILDDALDDNVGVLSDWCCMSRVLSLQSDFKSEKPLIQKYIEERGHKCIFLPKFHCELNPIKMVWGYAKYRKLLLTYLRISPLRCTV